MFNLVVMVNRLKLIVPLGIMLVTLCPAYTQSISGETFGFVSLSIAAGTGNSKKITLISIPLLDESPISGKSTGKITGVTAEAILSTGAGWVPGELSRIDAPHLLEITSGQAQGLVLLISTTQANTSDTVSINSDELVRTGPLTNTGISVNDSYRIRPADTLGSFFGTPDSTGVYGGTSSRSADTITLVNNGSSATYFYNTAVTPARWARVSLGSPDATHTPITPNMGMLYSRLANTPLQFLVIGKVPTQRQKLAVKNSGTSLISSYWPVTQTLVGLNLHTIPNWVSGSSGAVADTVVLVSNGSASSYFYNGAQWRKFGLGSPLADSVPVLPSTGIQISKKGWGSRIWHL